MGVILMISKRRLVIVMALLALSISVNAYDRIYSPLFRPLITRGFHTRVHARARARSLPDYFPSRRIGVGLAMVPLRVSRQFRSNEAT